MSANGESNNNTTEINSTESQLEHSKLGAKIKLQVGKPVSEDDLEFFNNNIMTQTKPPVRKSKPRQSSKTSAQAAFANFQSKPGSVYFVAKPDKFTVFKRTASSKKLMTNSNSADSVTESAEKAIHRLKLLLDEIDKGDELSVELLKRNLNFTLAVLETVIVEESRRLDDDDDELSEVDAACVPNEVRDWLASTFTRKAIVRKAGEKPKFRSIVNALRAGIFVERMFRRMSGNQGLVYPPAVIQCFKNLDDWSYDMFALNEASGGSALKFCVYELLNRYDLIAKFKISVQYLLPFLDKVEEGYSKYGNPYHNLVHGADVTQTMHYFMYSTGLMHWLTDLEIFAVLIAASIHDFEHTGTTNNFHINTRSDFAMLYNDRAILENHHASAAFRLLQQEEFNILANMSRDECSEFRTLVIDMVLATDMSYHFAQVKTMKNLINNPENIDKSKALSLSLHCADIAHPAKDWNVHYRWTMLLLDEFFKQGDREREMGLPCSPLCDRYTTMVPESQVGFIDFILVPSFDVAGDMLEKIVNPPEKKIAEEDTNKLLENSEEKRVDSPSSAGSEASLTPSIHRPWNGWLAKNRSDWKERAAKAAEERKRKEEEEAAKAKEEEEMEENKEEGQSTLN